MTKWAAPSFAPVTRFAGNELRTLRELKSGADVRPQSAASCLMMLDSCLVHDDNDATERMSSLTGVERKFLCLTVG